MTSAHPVPATAPQPFVRRPEHARADVAVIGAGVIGLATAWELRRRGRSVVVVDPEPGSGASRAAAGMLAPVSEVQYQQEPLYPLMRASAAEYPLFVAALERAAGGTVGHRATETLVCGVDAADRQALADLRELQGRHGMTVEPLTLRAARGLEPALSPRLSAAFRIPDDHQVDPRRLVAGLLAALVAPELPEAAAPPG
ncbi:FAD-dependent oxidoreductase, partial [Kocuria sp. NPDC057446]|uniref:FAD-dependent oxidoreductase n=1 Tax=Kocuria sp. NPDC057446 TaxID=3346137 RepID=UPI00369EE3FD